MVERITGITLSILAGIGFIFFILSFAIIPNIYYSYGLNIESIQAIKGLALAIFIIGSVFGSLLIIKR